MGTGPLVDEQIADGQKLIDQLVPDGFDVTVACWVRFAESAEHEWFFYIVSEKVAKDGLRAAALAVHQASRRIPPPWGPWITVSELRLVGPNDPLAKEVLAFRARFPGRSWYPGARLGSHTIELAYIYQAPANTPKSAAVGA
ncbi:MAG TPA: hypothetical protein VMS17_18520 [Gemmataceae bacterium]|nr:hypothetical protein [Gemmataceae bacterium]